LSLDYRGEDRFHADLEAIGWESRVRPTDPPEAFTFLLTVGNDGDQSTGDVHLSRRWRGLEHDSALDEEGFRVWTFKWRPEGGKGSAPVLPFPPTTLFVGKGEVPLARVQGPEWQVGEVLRPRSAGPFARYSLLLSAPSGSTPPLEPPPLHWIGETPLQVLGPYLGE